MVRERMWRTPLASAVLAIACAVGLGACGFSEEEPEGGGKVINWYVFNEPGGAFNDAVDRCNEQADGYRINYVRLPTDADQQRELVARRLAAKDSDIDIVGMDVIWTAEFAEAGWILEWEGQDAERAMEGVLEGPAETARYEDKVYAAPFTTNTQLLFYRKDRVDQPPETWEEMIEMAEEDDTAIEVQAARYEGLTVLVNSLVASAGGQIVDENAELDIDEEAVRKAAETIRTLARSPAAPPGMSNNQEDDARLGFESGRSNFQLNYTFVYASAAEKEGFQEKIGVARWPGLEGEGESRVTLGGINLGVGAYSKNKEEAFDAALCLAEAENQIVAAEKGGLPPTDEDLYDNPKVQEAFPFSDVLRETLAEGVPRPVSPAYSDISLAIQKSFHPPEDIDPDEVVDKLSDRLERAAQGQIF